MALLLEFVGAQLGHQADAAALVSAQVDHDSPALGLDTGQRGVELGAAVAAGGAEDVAGEAFGVDADQDVVAVADVAVHEGDVLDAVDGGAVAVGREGAVGGGQLGPGLAADGGFAATAVGDQILDRDDRQAVLAGEGDQLGQAQHRAVLPGDLDDRAGRAQAREAGEVDGGLGVAVARQDPAGPGAQREDVAGADEVVGAGDAVGEQLEGGGAVGGRDAGAHAVRGGGVDGDRERGLHRLGVVLDHLRELQAIQLLALHRGADQAAALAHHEGDDLGGRLLGGDDEVALVLAVLVVDDHDRAAGRDIGDGLLDRVEREVLEAVGAVQDRCRAHAGAPSRAGCAAARERSHQSRRPHRTSAP
ncbi:hypothetical protein SVIOM74S_08567 [Streptomyces violarus]